MQIQAGRTTLKNPVGVPESRLGIPADARPYRLYPEAEVGRLRKKLILGTEA